MPYTICASAAKTSIEVMRADPLAALAKFHEFEELGLTEIHVTTEAGSALTRDQLLALARASDGATGAAVFSQQA